MFPRFSCMGRVGIEAPLGQAARQRTQEAFLAAKYEKVAVFGLPGESLYEVEILLQVPRGDQAASSGKALTIASQHHCVRAAVAALEEEVSSAPKIGLIPNSCAFLAKVTAAYIPLVSVSARAQKPRALAASRSCCTVAAPSRSEKLLWHLR